MKFRTELQPEQSAFHLDPRRSVALIGSCFAQNIAREMEECGWNAFCGAGTLYNPLSIAKVLSLLIFDDDWEVKFKDSLFESEGVMHSWLFDSHFSRLSASQCVEAVAEIRDSLLKTLSEAEALIVTFGTAWCYYLAWRPDYVVANCHKQHPAMFLRKRISPEEISLEWSNLLQRFLSRYTDMTVIFTVSPVRHLKDGFEGNSRSKAALLLAVEDICEKNANAKYFPAFEIVCDDLRDYRFYDSDLVHPSEFAVDYIWEKFRNSFVDDAGEAMLATWRKERLRSLHRPIIRNDAGS